jgi:hypothetical protein
MVQRGAFPFYQKSIGEGERDSLSRGEYIPCAIAIVLLTSGLDYHLARLKYLRDVARPKPPWPHTPYFNWTTGDFLTLKIGRLLIKKNEKRLKEQLMELTIMRDSIAHPKLYLIRQLLRPDFTASKQKAKTTDWQHRDKALKRKRKRSERTLSLRLPLVPTWISYPDMVVCILVLIRFFNLLEEKYGSYFSMIGNFFARNNPTGFFGGWGERDRKAITLGTWGQAFFDSLTPADQQTVRKRLGAEVSKYVQRRRAPPQRPEFLRKAPHW